MRYDDPHIHSYLPSIQPQWIDNIQKHVLDFRSKIPYNSFKSTGEFNWYSDFKNARFTHPYALYSAGHAELDLEKAQKKNPLLFNRDREYTFLLSDSGGFQIATEQWKLKKLDNHEQFSFETLVEKREQVLRWQEAISDLAVVLEVPAWMDGITFDNALRLTQDNLKFYAENCSGEVPFLNVLHGDTFEQQVEWFEKTKWFNENGPGVGWGFSGCSVNNFYFALKMILYMHSKGHYPEFFHFLGNGTAQTSVIFYTLKKLLSRCHPSKSKQVNITQDASSEFQTTGRYGNIYERVNKRGDQRRSYAPYKISSVKFESEDTSFIRHDQYYPNVDSPILGASEGIVYGDVIATKEVLAKNVQFESRYNKDGLSDLILIAHNLWTKLYAIDETLAVERMKRRLEMGQINRATRELSKHIRQIVSNRWDHNLGKGMTIVTIGLWRLFYDEYEHEMTFNDRVKILDEFKEEATELFGKVPKNYSPVAKEEN